MLKQIIKFTILTVTLLVHYIPLHADTLNDVKKRSKLKCIVHESIEGFSIKNSSGVRTGLDVDICRAISAVIFDNPDKISYVIANASERFKFLRDGKGDILSRISTWTMSRDVAMGLNFTGVTYYDGQGFMVRRSLGIDSVFQLDAVSVCSAINTTGEKNAAYFFNLHKIAFKLVRFKHTPDVTEAYADVLCDVYTTDASGLYAYRLELDNPQEHVILPEIISKEPLGPMVREGDDKWFNLIKWVLFAMINAEELGVTSKNVDEMLKANNPAIKRLLGVEGKFGENMGVSNDWGYRIIKHVGNYGEIFEKNLGPETDLDIDRGINKLWNNGGIQYAPPIR